MVVEEALPVEEEVEHHHQQQEEVVGSGSVPRVRRARSARALLFGGWPCYCYFLGEAGVVVVVAAAAAVLEERLVHEVAWDLVAVLPGEAMN